MAARNGKEPIIFPCHKEFLFFNFPVNQKKTDNLTTFQRKKKADSKLWASWACDLCNVQNVALRTVPHLV